MTGQCFQRAHARREKTTFTCPVSSSRFSVRCETGRAGGDSALHGKEPEQVTRCRQTSIHVRRIGIKVAGGTFDSRNLQMIRTVSSGCSIGSKCDAPGTTASCAPGSDS